MTTLLSTYPGPGQPAGLSYALAELEWAVGQLGLATGDANTAVLLNSYPGRVQAGGPSFELDKLTYCVGILGQRTGDANTTALLNSYPGPGDSSSMRFALDRLFWAIEAIYQRGVTPSGPILGRITATPAGAFSFNRVLAADTGQPNYGKLARIRRSSDNTDLDYTSIVQAEAWAAGGGTITWRGIYNQVTGVLCVPSILTLEWTNVATGLYGITWTATGSQTVGLEAGARALLAGVAGVSMALVVGNAVTDSTASNYMIVSLASSTTSRHLIRSSASGGDMEYGGRRADTDTATIANAGNFGDAAIVLMTMDFTTRRVKLWRAGNYVGNYSGFQTAGVTDGTPQVATINSKTGATVCEAVWLANGLSDADSLTYDTDARLAYLNLIKAQTRVWDGARSWWITEQDWIDNGICLSTYTTQTGGVGLAEIDATTRQLLAERVLIPIGVWPIDEHNGAAQIKLDDGSRLLVLVGHGKTASANGANIGQGNHQYFWSKSATGRIDGFNDPVDIPNTIGQSNYLELFQSPTTNAVWCFTNDDAAVTWLALVSTDRGVTWTQKRDFFKQYVAPNGGQNQIYAFSRRISGDTIRIITTPHVSNTENALRLAEFNMATGDLISGSGLIQNVNTGSGALPDVTTLSTIYTAAPTKSARLNSVSDDGNMLAFMTYVEATGASSEYMIAIYNGGDRFSPSGWDVKKVCDNAGYLGTTKYNGGMEFAREAHTGIRIILSRFVGGHWELVRTDSADGGNTWVETILTTNSSALVRPHSPVNANTTLSIVYGLASYTDYDNWSSSLRWAQ